MILTLVVMGTCRQYNRIYAFDWFKPVTNACPIGSRYFFLARQNFSHPAPSFLVNTLGSLSFGLRSIKTVACEQANSDFHCNALPTLAEMKELPLVN